jgi:hypothetical protein
MDALQITLEAARVLFAQGEIEKAGKMAARAAPYVSQRYRLYDGDAPRSPEQRQLELDLRPAPVSPVDKKTGDSWDCLLN